jgi:hypothetical protein
VGTFVPVVPLWRAERVGVTESRRWGRPVRRIRITRASSGEIMEFATAIGPGPRQTGAVLLRTPRHRLDADVVRAVLAKRLGGIPRRRADP